MDLLNHTFATPEENLACDEALLNAAEQASQAREVLRFWESDRPLVVLGYSSHVEREVHQDFCRRSEIPILRRTSGGAAVVAGPGCLMYALVLSYQLRPQLRDLGVAHDLVMGRMLQALAPLVPQLEHRGTCDLALDGRKVSGNSVRCRRDHLLYHGTLLYRFPLELLDACLAMPPRQPDYRGGRGHGAFVANLPLDAESIRAALAQAWQADTPGSPPSPAELHTLMAEKYSRPEWNFKR
ncbi:MAG TPA: lipoate--protein ligase family protein [Pirellulales bacterium]